MSEISKDALREVGATYCGHGFWEIDSGGYIDTVLRVEFFPGIGGEPECGVFITCKRTNQTVGLMANPTDDQFRQLCQVLGTFKAKAVS